MDDVHERARSGTFKCLHGSPRTARGGPQFDAIALTTLGLAPWLTEWRWTMGEYGTVFWLELGLEHE